MSYTRAATARPDIHLSQAEDLVRRAWSNQTASPFLGQLEFDEATKRQAVAAVRGEISGRLHRCESVFRSAPFTSTWCVLHALAQSYGEDGPSVYDHIGSALSLDLSHHPDRERFKSAYRAACRCIGLRLQHLSQPTGLFFSNLGVADAQSARLAECLLRGAQRLGPPPEEDLSELRQWLRAATRDGIETYTRLQAALANDSTAYYAQLFCDWRAGEQPSNRSSAVFFSGLETCAESLGIDPSRLVSEPHLMWTAHGLALAAAPSSHQQIVTHHGVPEQLRPGVPWRIPTPWPETLGWSCGGTKKLLWIRPQGEEVLVFAMDTQRLVKRLRRAEGRLAVPAREVFVLSARTFAVEDGGQDMASVPQGDMHVALAEVGDSGACVRTDVGSLTLERETDPGIRAEGAIIGRSGALPLYASSSEVVVTSGAQAAEIGRILRLKFGDETWFVEGVAFDAEGHARLSFEALELPSSADPGRLEIVLLVKGADARPGARAEIVSRFFVWPGTDDFDPGARFEMRRAPGNYLPNTSEHLGQDAAGLWIDPSHGFRHAILSLEIDGRRRDFEIPVRGTRLFRNMISTRSSVPVALGSIVVLGHADRQDTLIVRSSERHADLHVRGAVIRRPFIGQAEWEIPASQIDPESPSGDQVALVFPDRRRELLCRVSRPIEPHRIEIQLDETEIRAVLELPVSCDGIGLEIVDESRGLEGTHARLSLGAAPVDTAPPSWLSAAVLGLDPEVVEIRIDRSAWQGGAGLGLIEIRETGSDLFGRLEDSRGRVFALPLIAHDCAPLAGRPEGAAGVLARVMATRFQPDCDVVVREEFDERMRSAISTIAARRFYSPLLPLAFARPLHGGGAFLSRLDLLDLDLAPELFSAEASCFSRLADVPSARHLGSMTQAQVMPIPNLLVELAAEEDLLPRWLDHLAGDVTCPPELGADALRQAFLAYRQHVQASDFLVCLEHETVGQTLKAALNVYASSLEELLTFDEAAGSDRIGVRLAAYLSSFARAARAGRAREFHEAVARRIGLPVAHVTPVTSLALQVAGEIFAYFMLFWALTERAAQEEKEGAR